MTDAAKMFSCLARILDWPHFERIHSLTRWAMSVSIYYVPLVWGLRLRLSIMCYADTWLYQESLK